MVIIGGGHAGCRAAQSLREFGWTGGISVVEAEDRHPYERPPLSKAVLSGQKGAGDAPILPREWFAEHRVEYLQSRRAVRVRRDAGEVDLSDRTTIRYHRLLIATGAEPNDLAVDGRHLSGITTLRSASDAERLVSWLDPGIRVAIVGGGLIGLEAAASAITRGCRVTVVEAGPRLMTRAIPAEIEAEVRAFHIGAGVDVRLGRTVSAITGTGRVAAVVLDDGESIACDVVVVCIGVRPRTTLAGESGLAVDNGIVVDRYLRTSDPNVFAAGDACAFDSGLYAMNVRLECWKSAEDQGRIAARNMLATGVAYDAVPWMWSDQYDNVIQVAGMPHLGSASVKRRTPGALLVFHLAADGRLVGVSGFGAIGAVARGVRPAQVMIERRLVPDISILADTNSDLREMARSHAA